MAEATTANSPSFQGIGNLLLRYADWALGLGVLGLMVTLVVPVNPSVLDLLLTCNITFSLLVLLVVLNVRDSSELSTFPTILLFATLLRLGLNVASTRAILSGGEAGSIITSFGSYVAAENLTVGLVVFLILIIIQFVVITKGAGRISEVSARFALDAMPGKQMAIDADLNAGLIDSDEARRRRDEISAEAEFYGSMDGASKFVRGDAVAGLIITALNLLGGIIVGSTAGLSVGEAAQRFSVLTIGDGLVSQIPALFVSTAAAVLTTRASGSNSLGGSLFAQVGGRPKATLIAAGVLFTVGLMPGMPKLPFFVLATLLTLGWRSTRGANGAKDLLIEEESQSANAPAEGEGEAPAEDNEGDNEGEEVKELLAVDRVALEIGYRLIPMVKDASGTGILEHISHGKEGVVLPPVRIKDNIRLEAGSYRVLVGGNEIARGRVHPDRFLAMDSGSVAGPIRGEETTDPAFGLPAWWIDEAERDEADILGYTVIDATSVLVTHLSEVLREHFADILSRDDVKELVETAKELSPAVVEELVPERMGYGEIQQVLRNLLREGVPVRNMPAILEALADNAGKSNDPETLTELVRQRLGRTLCELHASSDGVLHAVTLDPDIEARLGAAVGPRPDNHVEPIQPAYLQVLMDRIEGSLAEAGKSGQNAVLLVRSNVRRFLGELVRSSLPKTAVLSFNEVGNARSIETTHVVRLES
ncbi:MAG: flagellar biosynthesis protein FlhA [Planctomycetota bacterium]|jgi:flagellar biosynthesis protein FlhA